MLLLLFRMSRSKIIYYHILASPLYLFMLLPFPVIYLISDLLYLLMFYVIGYRKKVVYTNLRNSFPDATEEKIHRIAKGYYRFMVDLFLETFKTLTMSAKQMQKRTRMADMTLVYELKERNQNFLFVMGHYGNWEWCGHSFSLHHQYQLDALYHPLSNPFFNWLTNKIRSKFGMGLIPMQSSIREMLKRKGTLSATAFIADQTPQPENAYWLSFLNQDTPVFTGTEKIAKKFNYPVVFASVKRVKRGYYSVSFAKITDDPQSTPDGYITEQHSKLLEADIIAEPETWLWSHRRWKHKRQPNTSVE